MPTPPAHVAPGVGTPPLFNPAQLDDAGLSANAFRVFGRICRRWTRERGCYETKPNMAAGCRIGRDALYSALDELESRGFIARSGRGPAARIDWLPPSEWLDGPAEFVRGQGTNGSSGSGGGTPGVHPDPGDEVTPDPGDERSSGSEGVKGYPPKGIHEGTPSSTTTTLTGEAAPEADGAGVVVDDGGRGEGEVDPDRDAKNEAWRLLSARGVAQAVELAGEHWRQVPEAVAAYDAKLAAGEVDGPGWFAGALPRWRSPRKTPARQAATHVGRTPEQDRGSKAGAAAFREIEAGRLPGTPGGAGDWQALMAEEHRAARELIEAAGGRPGRRTRAGTRSARDLPTEPVEPEEVTETEDAA